MACACGRGGCPSAWWLRARAPVAGFDAAMHHEAGPSVQMMRVRFCLEAAEKPSYPAAYGILAMRMSTFLLLLSYVVWPRHMMVRRATSARGGVLSRFYGSAGGATGSGRRPFAFLVLPLFQPKRIPSGACRALSGGGRAGRATFARAINFSRELPMLRTTRSG